MRPEKIIPLPILLTLATMMITSCNSKTPEVKATPSINPEIKQQVLQIIRENPQVLIESVQNYEKEQQRKIQDARQTFLQQMTTNPSAVIGDSPITGAAEKKIVLLEFSDFQCPVCAQVQKPVKEFLAKYKDKVTFTYKHLPLPQHQEAIPAAKAAWAAGQQGKFWEYHDALFSQQDKLSEPLYTAIAKQLELDENRFNQDRQSAAAEAAIRKDIQLAESLGINGTPFFNLNGEPLVGAIDVKDLEAALNRVTATANNSSKTTPTPQEVPVEQTPQQGQ